MTIWDYIRQRRHLDDEILEKFARPITIMFTDIKGSTTFYDTRGDIDGVAMIDRHNQLVHPAIESHGGRVLQTLGDGLLVTFPKASPAVRAAIEIQRELQKANAGRPAKDQIHVRIGINSGMGLVEESNVYGDAVNVAARLQGLAQPDQIIVSESTYREAVPDFDPALFQELGATALKGKLERQVVHEVVWEETGRPTGSARGLLAHRRTLASVAGLASLTALAALVYFRTPLLPRADLGSDPEQAAIVALREGRIAVAEDLCTTALRTDPQRLGCRLVVADLAFLRGDLGHAAAAYRDVLSSGGIGQSQRATAYNRLGRVAVEQGQLDTAAAAYSNAQAADPSDWESLSNLGALLRKQGKAGEAQKALERAAALRPEDPTIGALLKESRDAAALARDEERQRRTSALIAELSQRFKRGDIPGTGSRADGWSSKPLTLSILGFEGGGRGRLREGEGDAFLIWLGQTLEAESRTRLVDRSVIDALLAELKLATTPLVDPSAAVRLGRLLSARLIATVSAVVIRTESQVALRVIETETSAVVASLARTFPVNAPLQDIARGLGKELAAKLRSAYPLRARVVSAAADRIVLDVGTAEGAHVGQRFQLLRDGPRADEIVAEVEIIAVQEHRSMTQPAPGVAAGLKAVAR